MADLNAIAISVVKTVMFGAVGFFLLFGVWKIINFMNKNFIFKLRYKKFSSIPSSVLTDCVNAIDDGKTSEEFVKDQIITKGFKPKQSNELSYIYDLVRKEIQGGIEHGEKE